MLPLRKESRIGLKIANVSTIAELAMELNRVLQAVGRGVITTEQGQRLADLRQRAEGGSSRAKTWKHACMPWSEPAELMRRREAKAGRTYCRRSTAARRSTQARNLEKE